MSSNRSEKLLLPGMKPEELVLEVVAVKRPTVHACSGPSCKNAAHKPAPHGHVYLWDERPDGPWQSGGMKDWTCWYATKLHPDLIREWEARVGPASDPSYGIRTLRIIRWSDGTVLTVAEAGNMIFSEWVSLT